MVFFVAYLKTFQYLCNVNKTITKFFNNMGNKTLESLIEKAGQSASHKFNDECMVLSDDQADDIYGGDNYNCTEHNYYNCSVMPGK